MSDFKVWLKAAGVRSLKTVCQTAVALIEVSTIMNDVDWMMVGSASLLSGVLSILTSIAGLPGSKAVGRGIGHSRGYFFCVDKKCYTKNGHKFQKILNLKKKVV